MSTYILFPVGPNVPEGFDAPSLRLKGHESVVFMTKASVQAKVKAADKRLGVKCLAGGKLARIDRTESSFGGKGCLTEEQYDKAMLQSKKMQDLAAW